jgi:hypothetical protein
LNLATGWGIGGHSFPNGKFDSKGRNICVKNYLTNFIVQVLFYSLAILLSPIAAFIVSKVTLSGNVISDIFLSNELQTYVFNFARCFWCGNTFLQYLVSSYSCYSFAPYAWSLHLSHILSCSYQANKARLKDLPILKT